MSFRITIAVLIILVPLTTQALDWRSFLAEIIPVRGGEQHALIWRQINHGDKKTLTTGIHGIITCPLTDPVAPLQWAGPQDLGTRADGMRVYEYTPGFGPEKFVDQPDPSRWPSQRWGFGPDPSLDTLFEFERGRRYYLFANVDVEMTCTKGEQTSSSPSTSLPAFILERNPQGQNLLRTFNFVDQEISDVIVPITGADDLVALESVPEGSQQILYAISGKNGTIPHTLFRIDSKTGQATPVSSFGIPDINGGGLAYHPQDDLLYGAANGTLFTFQPSSANFRTIGVVPEARSIAGLSVDPAGNLLAFDPFFREEGPHILSLKKNTGEVRTVSPVSTEGEQGALDFIDFNGERFVLLIDGSQEGTPSTGQLRLMRLPLFPPGSSLPPFELLFDTNLMDIDGLAFPKRRSGITSLSCGDWKLDPGEECDDGNVFSGDGCNALCQLEIGFCGDGVVQTLLGEECEPLLPGPYSCTQQCKIASGDQTSSPSSAPSSQPSSTPLSSTSSSQPSSLPVISISSSFPPLSSSPISTSSLFGGDIGEIFHGASGCGDGFLEETEECDDANSRDFDGCSAGCQLEIGICGDGVVQKLLGEECEPLLHDATLPYRCTQQCKIASLSCGDGKMDPGEECDKGKENSDRPDAACRTTCKFSRCSDGLLDTDEECDDGNLFSGDGCNDLCRIAIPVGMISGRGFPMFPDLPEFPYDSGYAGVPWTVGQGVAVPQAVDAMGRPIPFSQWTASIMTAPLNSPVGDTGPAIVVVMAGGAAAGMAWIRRRRG